MYGQPTLDWRLVINNEMFQLYFNEEKSAVVEWLALVIRNRVSRVRSPVAALRTWWSALGQGTLFSSLVSLPGDHE